MEKQIKLVRIGAAQGIRLPKAVRRRYGFADSSVILEETAAGLLLRKQGDGKLSWAETYQAMSAEREDWSDFEAVAADGTPGQAQGGLAPTG